ncbi:MAG: hypothetical protein E7447_03010 [Ruminococcaceae bacterium]|nr:hypothetical protein [Oscillospiraceae bacterium]
MKKIVSLTALLLVIALLFAGCKETFDTTKSVNKLLNKGLVISQEYSTTYQLKEASAMFNAEIRFYGGNFTVEVKRGVALEDPKEPGSNCQFIELATEDQAIKYAEHYIKVRKNDNEYKVAQSGTVVVITNLEIAAEVIPLEFK